MPLTSWHAAPSRFEHTVYTEPQHMATTTTRTHTLRSTFIRAPTTPHSRQPWCMRFMVARETNDDKPRSARNKHTQENHEQTAGNKQTLHSKETRASPTQVHDRSRRTSTPFFFTRTHTRTHQHNHHRRRCENCGSCSELTDDAVVMRELGRPPMALVSIEREDTRLSPRD